MLEGTVYGRWPQRSEPINTVCEQLLKTLKCLQATHPKMSDWFLGGEAIGQNISGSTSSSSDFRVVHDALERNVVSKSDGRTSPHLGRRITLFGGPPAESQNYSVALRVTCCKCGEYSGENTFNVSLPSVGCSALELRRLSTITDIIKCFATIWRPRWIVFRDLSQQAGMPSGNNRPHTGVVTYRSDLRLESVPTIDGVEIRELNVGGLLIYPTEVPLDPSKFILKVQSVLAAR